MDGLTDMRQRSEIGQSHSTSEKDTLAQHARESHAVVIKIVTLSHA